MRRSAYLRNMTLVQVIVQTIDFWRPILWARRCQAPMSIVMQQKKQIDDVRAFLKLVLRVSSVAAHIRSTIQMRFA